MERQQATIEKPIAAPPLWAYRRRRIQCRGNSDSDDPKPRNYFWQAFRSFVVVLLLSRIRPNRVLGTTTTIATNNFFRSGGIQHITKVLFLIAILFSSSVDAWMNPSSTTTTLSSFHASSSVSATSYRYCSFAQPSNKRRQYQQNRFRRYSYSPLSLQLSQYEAENDDSDDINNNLAGVKSRAAEAFHDDMRRVLLSRRHAFEEYIQTFSNANANVPTMVSFPETRNEQQQYSKKSNDRTNNNSKGRNYDYNYNDIRWERRIKPVIMDSDIDGAIRVLTMLRHLQRIGSATESTYQIAMRAFLNRGRLRWSTTTSDLASDVAAVWCAADQLEELLNELLLVKDPREISLETYNFVLQAYAVCSTPRGDRNYAERATQLYETYIRPIQEQREEEQNLNQNEEESEQLDWSNYIDSKFVESMMHLCHAYSWQQANLQKSSDCAYLANEWLEQIQQMTNDTYTLLQAHEWVIEAWSKSGSPGSAAKADELLQYVISMTSPTIDSTTLPSMVSSEKEDKSGIRIFLNAEIFSNAILAWSKATEPNAAQRAQELLNEMLYKFESNQFPIGSEPPLIAFNGVITAWGRIGRPDKAEEVLWSMDQLRARCTKLVPNAISFNTVMHGYIRSRDKQFALQKVLSLVHYMEDNGHDQPAIRPNCFTYNTLLKCYIQSPASSNDSLAEEAESILMKMERLWEQGDVSLEPTNRIFNMVMNAYAKSNHRDAAQKAFDLLRRMKSAASTSKNHRSGSNQRNGRRRRNYEQCKPDIISYTSAIECASKSTDSNAPELAEQLLNEATTLYETTGDDSLMPNLRTYTMTILTLANHNGNPARARALLDRLLQLYEETKHPDLAPNTYPYNYVLNCAANSLGDKVEAFQVATRTYQDMRKSDIVRPDPFTYAFWIKCCNNLLNDGTDIKTKCITYAFQECKKEGLVSNEVLVRLFQSSPPSLVDELLELTSTSSTESSSSKFPKQQQRLSKSTFSSSSTFGKQQSPSRPMHRSLLIENIDSAWSRNVRTRR